MTTDPKNAKGNPFQSKAPPVVPDDDKDDATIEMFPNEEAKMVTTVEDAPALNDLDEAALEAAISEPEPAKEEAPAKGKKASKSKNVTLPKPPTRVFSKPVERLRPDRPPLSKATIAELEAGQKALAKRQ